MIVGRVRWIIACLLGVYVLLFTSYARAEHCRTKLIDHEMDFVDPTGFPLDRQAPKAIPIDTSQLVIRISQDFPKDLPERLPGPWKLGFSSFERMTLRYERHPGDYFLVKFLPAFDICNLIKGWELWQEEWSVREEKSRPTAFLVFERNGRKEVLTSSVDVTLLPGVSVREFDDRVRYPLQGSDVVGYAEKTTIDQKTGRFVLRVAAGPKTFPLRLALRLAGYGEPSASRGFVASVAPFFIPLVSTVKTELWLEKFLPHGKQYRILDNEPALIEQYYPYGVDIKISVDLLYAPDGEPYLRLLSDARELADKLVGAFGPILPASDIKVVPPGCRKTKEAAPDARYMREVLSCAITIFKEGDFMITRVPIRLEDRMTGNTITLDIETEQLVRVLRARHGEQKGIIGYVPPFVVERKETETPAVPSSSSSTVKDEREMPHWQKAAGRWVKQSVYAPAGRFFSETWSSPRSALRRLTPYLLIVGAAAIGARMFFWKSFWVVPPLASVLLRQIFFLIRLIAIFLIPLYFFWNKRSGWYALLCRAGGSRQLKNLSAPVLAQHWRIAMPMPRDAFLEWVSDAKRTGLERIVGAIFLEENMLSWEMEGGMTGETLQGYRRLLRKSVSGLKIHRIPFAVWSIRKEIRSKE